MLGRGPGKVFGQLGGQEKIKEGGQEVQRMERYRRIGRKKQSKVEQLVGTLDSKALD